ncbi:MAG: hypothetical protein H7338_19435 [Candidatus Sericytochromatia bacterium]|nr:hypothetical protein [Candidatus Sericytochromatia bacterium]
MAVAFATQVNPTAAVATTTTKVAAPAPQAAQAAQIAFQKDAQQLSGLQRGNAPATTSFANFSPAKLGKGVACVVLPAVGIIGLTALIARVNSPAAFKQIARGIAADPGSVGRALAPKANNTMLYIGLAVTVAAVALYSCQKD